jgi:hypothetical protein
MFEVAVDWLVHPVHQSQRRLSPRTPPASDATVVGSPHAQLPFAGASKRGRGRENDTRVKKLCRFLGFGLLAVTAEGRVDVVAEPVPWKPRRDAKRRSRIVEEHRRRMGDPVVGGSTRVPHMTAYRQQALAVAHALAGTPHRPRDLRTLAPDAAKILQGKVYGWFERIERGCMG